jgi:hypothetical protein
MARCSRVVLGRTGSRLSRSQIAGEPVKRKREGEEGEPLMTVGVGTRSLAERLLESLTDEVTTVRIMQATHADQRQQTLKLVEVDAGTAPCAQESAGCRPGTWSMFGIPASVRILSKCSLRMLGSSNAWIFHVKPLRKSPASLA